MARPQKDKANHPSGDQQAKLPTHAAYTSLQNRITLLHSSRSTLLKSLTSFGASTGKPSPLPNPHDREKAEEEDFTSGVRPNEGVGYVADKKHLSARDSRKEDEILRRKFLGKRARGEDGLAKSSRREESSEDEEWGRSALGRAKRKRKKGKADLGGGDEGETAQDDGVDHEEGQGDVDEPPEVKKAKTAVIGAEEGPSMMKKNKKKKRKKGHGDSTM